MEGEVRWRVSWGAYLLGEALVEQEGRGLTRVDLGQGLHKVHVLQGCRIAVPVLVPVDEHAQTLCTG